MKRLIAIFVVLLLELLQVQSFPPAPNVTVAKGYYAELWAKDLPLIRSLVYDAQCRCVLALLSGSNQVVALKESPDGKSVTKTVLINSPNPLTHGLAVHKGYIYASSPNTVWRWPYRPNAASSTNSGSVLNSVPELVVKNVGNVGPSDTAAGHITRTLVFDKADRLYISVGSNWNVDPDSFRSRIRRVDLSRGVPNDGLDFLKAEVFADGLRNEVGMAFDSRGRLWGVENGADRLQRTDLGQDIFQNNPAEEVNLFDGPPGTFYGYPWCWSAYKLPSKSNASDTQYLKQFSWPQDEPSNHPDYRQKYSDAWCQDPKNNRPPVMGLPAHTAPLGISFYDGTGCNLKGAFDCWMKGDAFVALHGSWNRDVPDGYSVARLPFTPQGLPDQSVDYLIWQTDHQTRCITDAAKKYCFRPVNAIFLPSGKMLVSSDTTGTIVQVARDPTVQLTTPPARGHTPPSPLTPPIDPVVGLPPSNSDQEAQSANPPVPPRMGSTNASSSSAAVAPGLGSGTLHLRWLFIVASMLAIGG